MITKKSKCLVFHYFIGAGGHENYTAGQAAHAGWHQPSKEEHRVAEIQIPTALH